MTDFTPGPWLVAGENTPECWEIEDEEGLLIARCEDFRGLDFLDGVANARLIAAAPDLYAAVEALHAHGHTDAVWAQCERALANARGETA